MPLLLVAFFFVGVHVYDWSTMTCLSPRAKNNHFTPGTSFVEELAEAGARVAAQRECVGRLATGCHGEPPASY